MRDLRVSLAAGLALAFICGPQVAIAAPAAKAHISISGDPHGYVLRSEKATQHGTYVATFASADSTIAVVGSAGTTVFFGGIVDLPNGNHGIEFGTEESVDKTSPVRGKGSVADALTDLGVPSSEAKKFAATSSAGQPTTQALAAASSRVTHLWQNSQVCYTYTGTPSFYGYGCGTSWVDWQDPRNLAHWGLTSQYKFTAAGTGWYRLKGACWRMEWSSGNTITDWEPYSTSYASTNCSTQSFSIELKVGVPPFVSYGIAESYSQQICPEYYGPWIKSSFDPRRTSGAKWYNSKGVDNNIGMGVAGAQSVDNPAEASAAVKNYYAIEY